MTGQVLLAHRLQVRFSDCDPLGHVNNAKYLTYLEQARIVLWRAQIGSWARLRPDGTRGEGFILARAEVDFRAQAREGDELEVRLALGSFGRTSATYEYEIADVATGTIVVDREDRAGVVRLRHREADADQGRDEAQTRTADPIATDGGSECGVRGGPVVLGATCWVLDVRHAYP